jgi:hypothetical protein
MASAIPVSPDFTGLAYQQAGLNQQAANAQTTANRANQYGPGGMLTWSQGPNGQWTQNTSLSPTNQGMVDWAQGGLIGAGGALDRLNNPNTAYGNWGSSDVTSGLSAMPDAGFGADQKTIDAMRGLQSPQLQAAEDARRAQLAAQGITQGSRISDLTERELGNTRSDADMKAILAGTQEYGNVFNRGMQSRQQGFNENVGQSQLATALRQAKQNADINQVSSETGVINQFQNPKFSSYSSATTAPAADIYGAAGDRYRADLDAFRVAQGNQNANSAASDARRTTNMGLLGGAIQGMGGLSGIGGMLGGAGNWLSGLFGGNAGSAGYDYDAMDQLANSFNYNEG